MKAVVEIGVKKATENMVDMIFKKQEEFEQKLKEKGYPKVEIIKQIRRMSESEKTL